MSTLTQTGLIALLLTVPVTVSAQAPAPPPPQIQLRATINGGLNKSVQIAGNQRKITVTQGDETIAIEDANEKNNVIRRTRTVNGEKKTEEFKAPDLETLKKNHPDVAELYRKHTEGVLNGEKMQAQLQLQLQQRLNGGDPFGVPRNALPRRGQGTRKITSTAKGKTIEIEDRYGEKIVMKITDKKSRDPQMRTIEAEDLAELTTKDAEAAGHYKRLTAEN